jgi:4-diphosphocytidyl-2-C-methyl-D-erythritol kinase
MGRTFKAPAKVNLTLEVLARRDDGYHGIRSLMVPLTLSDELTIDRSDTFAFACNVTDLAGDDNLVVRTARALQAEPLVNISLEKRIPSQAGLGGGSSDAAAVLRAAMAGSLGELPPINWLALARSLGSDVPFFLTGTAALVEGTGERVTAVGALPPWHVLVVKPPVAVSTAAAYAELDRHPRAVRPRNDSISIEALTALQRGDFATVERCLQNDFHEVIATSTPPIADALDALRAAGARNALLAGSGSCVFTLAPDTRTIESVNEQLALGPEYRRFVTAFAETPDWRT